MKKQNKKQCDLNELDGVKHVTVNPTATVCGSGYVKDNKI